jgi:acyl dehydratase
MTQRLTIEELKKLVGQPWLTLTYPIERGMVQHFVEAVGDHNPRWQGPKAEAPPALLLTIGFERVISMLLSLPEAVLHGSTELECFESVRVGDTITVTAKVSALRERPPMTFVNLELEQHNQKGVLVARCKQLAILRGKA